MIYTNKRHLRAAVRQTEAKLHEDIVKLDREILRAIAVGLAAFLTYEMLDTVSNVAQMVGR